MIGEQPQTTVTFKVKWHPQPITGETFMSTNVKRSEILYTEGLKMLGEGHEILYVT